MAKKFDAKKLAALFGEEGKPVEKVLVKPNDPTVTGKGVSKEVRKHVAKKELLAPSTSVVVAGAKGKDAGVTKATSVEPDVEPTPAEQKRAYRAAQQKALTKLLELPPTKADLEILASTKLDPGVKVMRYHGKSGWSVCLMWLEQREDEKTKVVSLAKIHSIIQMDTASLSYEKMRPEELRHFADIQGGYPIGQGIEAFRRHADTYGATREVRAMLGMSADAPPKMIVVQQRDDDGNLIGEIKVPKNQGNPHEPKPSVDLDDLYKRAAKLLDIREEDLRQKYGHLGNGMQSMNLRNRLRGKGFNV